MQLALLPTSVLALADLEAAVWGLAGTLVGAAVGGWATLRAATAQTRATQAMALAQTAYEGFLRLGPLLTAFEDPAHVPTDADVANFRREAAALAIVLPNPVARAMPGALWLNLFGARELRVEIRRLSYFGPPPAETRAGIDLPLLQEKGKAAMLAAWRQHSELEKAIAEQVRDAHALVRNATGVPAWLRRRRVRAAYRRAARTLIPTARRRPPAQPTGSPPGT